MCGKAPNALLLQPRICALDRAAVSDAGAGAYLHAYHNSAICRTGVPKSHWFKGRARISSIFNLHFRICEICESHKFGIIFFELWCAVPSSMRGCFPTIAFCGRQIVRLAKVAVLLFCFNPLYLCAFFIFFSPQKAEIDNFVSISLGFFFSDRIPVPLPVAIKIVCVGPLPSPPQPPPGHGPSPPRDPHF